jgi:hypothetical protein
MHLSCNLKKRKMTALFGSGVNPIKDKTDKKVLRYRYIPRALLRTYRASLLVQRSSPSPGLDIGILHRYWDVRINFVPIVTQAGESHYLYTTDNKTLALWFPTGVPRQTRVPWRGVRGAAKYRIYCLFIKVLPLRMPQIAIFSQVRVPPIFF